MAYSEERYQDSADLVDAYLIYHPGATEALNLQGSCYRRLGRLPEAEQSFNAALHIDPNFADALSNLANLKKHAGDAASAERLYLQALRANPAHIDALFQLASLYHVQGRLNAAEVHYRTLLGHAPDHIDAHYNLGLLTKAHGRLRDAITHFRHIIKCVPTHADAHANLGNCLNESGQFSEALLAYQAALMHKPRNPDTHYNLGTLLERLKRHRDAEIAYKAALEIAPSHFHAKWKLNHIRRYLCDWSPNPIADLRFDETLAIPEGGAVSPFEFLSHPGVTAQQQRRITSDIARARGYADLAKQASKSFSAKTAGGRLRIGYLSADFYDHATTRLLAGVIENHRSDQFQITAYAYGPQIQDTARQRIATACHAFVDISQLSDAEAADRIRVDGIDLLVELKGFTSGARLGISARRPAPVIISWLGYPGTLGEPALADYVIGDPLVTPLAHQHQFSETLALMPHSYQPNDQKRLIGPVPDRVAVGLPADAVVFCNFNQTYKLNPEVFDIWCALLRDVPSSILWLLANNEEARTNLQREASQRGVSAARLIFAPYTSSPQAHLCRLQCADIALDTAPYGSHTTGSDALWANVPMVSCMGETFASRVGASLLSAVGLPELIATDWHGYYAIAKRLAADSSYLTMIKKKLAATRQPAPLFNTVGFARDLERLYTAISLDHDHGLRRPIDLRFHDPSESNLELTGSNPPSAIDQYIMSINDLLQPNGATTIVDVGANPVDGAPPYKEMLAAGLCQVIGFEPQPDALALLHASKGPNETYLPYALGDGAAHTLNICRASGMTSLLEPDPQTLALFEVLRPLSDVVQRVPMCTRRLDDTTEIDHLDFLKIDVQGSELVVFQNGRKKLADAVVIQTEVSFITLYKNQPTQGDVDQELRRQGFIPHGFAAIKKWPIAPCVINGNPRKALNQLLEADMVYIRDIAKPEAMSDEQLKQLALLVHHLYGSFDLALRCVMLLEQRGALPANAQKTYLRLLAKK